MARHKIFDSLAAAQVAVPLHKTRLLLVDGRRVSLAYTPELI